MEKLYAWVTAGSRLLNIPQLAIVCAVAIVAIAVLVLAIGRFGIRRIFSGGEPDAADAVATDPTRTISDAVRGLRVRYIAATSVVAVLGILFVAGTHQRNVRFSNATSMAGLVAKTAETTDRISRAAMEMSGAGNAEAEWTEAALGVHAEALRKTIEATKALWLELDDELRSRLLVKTPYGDREAIGLLEQFQAEVAAASAGGAADRIATGKRIDGTIGFLVQPALAQQAKALRDFNRATADRVKLAINIVGGIAIAFAAAILFFIFLPMDRSIRVALAKLSTAIEAAKSADRAKSEFLANMSHEIRTPMNGVLGMAELMSQTELDARQRTFNDVILKSGNALLTIINDILDFSKIDAGHTELDPAPFELREAVEDVATLVSSRVSEKNLELIVRVDPELPDWIVGDVGRIRQILTNLAGNAVKFTQSGHVLIEVSLSDGDVLFRVTDTGIGIAEDKLAGVFEKFSQVDSSSTRRHEGTGLGLAIASRLVSLMGGTIGATSQPGKGSVFSFRIPFTPHGAMSKAPIAASDTSGARILIVDDNAVNRDILAEMARNWGFDACAIENGRLALGFLDHAAELGAAADLVVLDYQMPGMNGAEVLRAIRDTPSIASTPVVLLTSVDHAVAVRELKLAGADAILTKPTRSSLLLTTIADELRRSRSAGETPVQPPETPLPQPEAVTPPLPRTVEPSTASGNLDILVAEDNDVNQFVFSQILGGLDYSFAMVGDGEQALETWRRRRPSLILMDVSMPDMNGFEATRRIRHAENAGNLPHTPIVGVTAHALKGDRERCLEAGMDDYLTKPISPERLESKLRDWLDPRLAKRA